MTMFEWSSAYETGISGVDRQHEGLVDLINALGDCVSDNRDLDHTQIARLGKQLEDYAATHFSEEEAVMHAHGLAPRFIEAHEKQHRSYLREVRRLQHGESESHPTDPLLRFLTHWLSWHILGSDHSMARQMRSIETGTSPEEALAAEEARASGATQPLLAALHGLFEQVGERNARLLALNETLEARVAERTRDLTHTVQKLELEKEASARLTSALAEANRHLEELALTDPLTGLPNRRHAMAQMERAWKKATEKGDPFSVMVVDADHFKWVNDTHGHDAGDVVLTTLSKELRNGVRTDDTVCRMGGDEFLVICPHTPLQGARGLADGIWSRISQLKIPVGDSFWQGSISMGLATKDARTESIASLLKEADAAVYRAKEAGRNRVMTCAS